MSEYPRSEVLREYLNNHHWAPKSCRTSEDQWRQDLQKSTEPILRLVAEHAEMLSVLNSIGVYHKFRKLAGDPEKDFETAGSVPSSWVIRGYYPGIWCALFEAGNTFSIAARPMVIAQVKFNDGWYLYDPCSENHKQQWVQWCETPEHLAEPNPWQEQASQSSQSMASRLERFTNGPNHHAFFQKYHYGAIIGYDDYLAIVIINEKAVRSMVFDTLK